MRKTEARARDERSWAAAKWRSGEAVRGFERSGNVGTKAHASSPPSIRSLDASGMPQPCIFFRIAATNGAFLSLSFFQTTASVSDRAVKPAIFKVHPLPFLSSAVIYGFTEYSICSLLLLRTYSTYYHYNYTNN